MKTNLVTTSFLNTLLQYQSTKAKEPVSEVKVEQPIQSLQGLSIKMPTIDTSVLSKIKIPKISLPRLQLPKPIIRQATSRVPISQPAQKLESYEKLSGVSDEIPEIILFADFLPFFDDKLETNDLLKISNGDLSRATDTCKLFDINSQISFLKNDDIENLLLTLYKKYPTLTSQIETNNKNFVSFFNKNTEHIKNILQLQKLIEISKSNLDVRDNAFYTKDIIPKYGIRKNEIENIGMTLSHQQNVLEVLSFIDKKINKKNYKSKISSTKAWSYLLMELKSSLKGNKYLTNISPESIDDNPTKLSYHYEDYFGVYSIQNIYDIQQLQSSVETAMNSVIAIMRNYWDVMYKNKNSIISDYDFIFALSNVFSKELRYSRSFGNKAFTDFLKNTFSYTTNESNNLDIFDYVIGQFGKNTTDVPSPPQSLIGVSQKQFSNNVSVMTFESKYIQNEVGTLTPGSFYIFDDVVNSSNNISVARINEFESYFNNLNKNFIKFVSDINVLTKRDDSIPETNKKFYTPAQLVKRIYDEYFTPKPTSQYDFSYGFRNYSLTRDFYSSIFVLANENSKVKTLLFLIVMLYITRYSYDAKTQNYLSATTQISILANELANEILSLKLMPNAVSTNDEVEKINRDSLVNYINTNGITLSVVSNFMLEALRCIRNDGVLSSDTTRYSGLKDTQVMMMLFDVIVKCITSIVDFRILGSTTSQNINDEQKIIIRKSSSLTNNYQLILNKLNKEQTYIHQLVFNINSILQKNSQSLTDISNYLNTETYKTSFNTISKILGEDTHLIKRLMTEQQMMLMTNGIVDLSDKLSKLRTSSANVSLENKPSDKLNQLLYRFLSNPDFLTPTGFNKKVISVGVPIGFVSKIRQKINIENYDNAFTDKQKDIVNFCIYKKNIKKPGLIYKPKKFLFELSRFVTRNTSVIKSANNTSYESILQSIPTQDWGDFIRNFCSTIVAKPRHDYWSQAQNNPNVQKNSYNQSSYSFLDESEKKELIKNHITSFLLETYIKTLSGLDVNDLSFCIKNTKITSNSTIINSIRQHFIAFLAEKSIENKQQSSNVGYKINPSTTQTNNNLVTTLKIEDVEANIKLISPSYADVLVHGLKTIAMLENSTTTFSSAESVIKGILIPKKFDRVINLIIDPDDFDINNQEMSKYDQSFFDQLITSKQIFFDETTNSYKETSRTPDDLEFEEYFVAIETFGNESL